MNKPSPVKTLSFWQRLIQSFHSPLKTRQELITHLRLIDKNHLIDEDSLTMFEGILSVAEMTVADIMIPRNKMVMIEENMSCDEFLPLITQSKHSRFPVLNQHRDEVIGILLAKDLLGKNLSEPNFSIRELLRPAVVIPGSKRLNILLKDFRDKHHHMAIVVDEYGNIAGLITIEDVLEQIVGDIEDEYFHEEEYIKKISKNKFTLKAHMPIDDFNEYFKTDFDNKHFDTIGGLVMQKFGHVPKRGEHTHINDYEFKILNANRRRIFLLEVTLAPQDNQSEENKLSGE